MNATNKNVDFSEITIQDVCYEDRNVIEYYSKCRGKNCIVTIPKRPTSWEFSVTFQ